MANYDDALYEHYKHQRHGLVMSTGGDYASAVSTRFIGGVSSAVSGESYWSSSAQPVHPVPQVRTPIPYVPRSIAPSSSPPSELKKRGYMDEVRAYVKEHRDILFTIVLVLLLDHIFFAGAMRERVKQLLSGMIGHAEQKLGLPVGSMEKAA